MNTRLGFEQALIAATLLVAGFFPFKLCATPCVDYASSFRVVGSHSYGNGPFAAYPVAAYESYVYAPSTTDLEVYDVSDPSAPQFVSTISLPNPFSYPSTGITIQGTIAYVSMGPGGNFGQVLLVDLQDPENPVVVRSISTPTTPFDIAATDQYAYAACAGGRFAILDVNPPASASLVTTVSMGGGDARGASILGSFFLVAAGTKGLRCYDISSPTAPVLLDTSPVPTSDLARDVTHDGDTGRVAFLIDKDVQQTDVKGRIEVFDVSTSGQLQLLGSTDLLDQATGIVMNGSALFASISESVESIDLADPGQPAHAGALSTWGVRGMAVDHARDLLVVGSGAVFHVAEISNPRSVEVVHTGLHKSVLAGSGNLLFTSGAWSEIEIRDATSVPLLPSIGSYTTPTFQPDIQVRGSLGVVWPLVPNPIEHGRVEFVDLSTPSAPAQLSSFTLPGGSIIDVALGDGVACVTQSDEWDPLYRYGFRVIDLDDPEIPQLVYDLEIRYSLVEMHDGFAYVLTRVGVNDAGVDIFDVRNPSAATLVNQFLLSDPNVESFKIFGGRLYINYYPYWNRLAEVFDLSNPSIPVLVGSTSLVPVVRGGVLRDGYFYGSGEGVVMDISNPSSPEVLGAAFSGYPFTRVVEAAGEIFASGLNSGIYEVLVLPPQCRSNPTAAPLSAASTNGVSVAPNPFRVETTLRFDLPRESSTRLTIHDVSGRLVRRITSDVLPAGRHSFTWDGHNLRGDVAPAGIYFVRMEASGSTKTERIVRLR